MDTNSLSQSLDSVNTAVSVAGEEEVSHSGGSDIELLYYQLTLVRKYLLVSSL